MRDDSERLHDILDAISKLQNYSKSHSESHNISEIELMGLVKCIEIIGEACRCLSEDFRVKYNHVPWRQIANMRNILAHQYFEIDTDKVELVIKKNIPELKKQVEEILHDAFT